MRSRSLRVRLTLLYAIPFLVSGAVLLSLSFLGTSHTVPAPGQGDGGVPSSVPHPGPAENHVTISHTWSLVGLAVMVPVSLLVGWFIAGRFLRPLQTITATAREISATDLHRRIGLTSRDELGELGATLDGLFERLEAAFAAQRDFVANASHELRTPLTAERTVLQVALSDSAVDVDTLRAACHEVLALGEQQEQLIAALLTLATGEQALDHRERLDLAAVAHEVVHSRRAEAERRGLRLQTHLNAAPIAGDLRLVGSLVANLVDNALRYNVPGGWIEVTTGGADGPRCAVVVRNSGPVVPPDELGRLLRPFQQLAGPRIGPGHGLGLAIVSAIARAHGATVTPRTRPDGGLDIEVVFDAL
jgi:signal transduction histidine kinase